MWGKGKRIINVLEVRMQGEGAFIQRKVCGDIDGQTKRGRSRKAGAKENVESKYEPQINRTVLPKDNRKMGDVLLELIFFTVKNSELPDVFNSFS